MTKRQAEKLCQCPERGDLHFYMSFLLLPRIQRILCQCPERGDLHFYIEKTVTKDGTVNCVNALKGATSISTMQTAIDLGRSFRVSMP